jgi:hypothetical protein
VEKDTETKKEPNRRPTHENTEATENHKKMVNSYRAFADGGAKEQDERLLAQARRDTAGIQMHKQLADMGLGNLLEDIDREAAASALEQIPVVPQGNLLD